MELWQPSLSLIRWPILDYDLYGVEYYKWLGDLRGSPTRDILSMRLPLGKVDPRKEVASFVILPTPK